MQLIPYVGRIELLKLPTVAALVFVAVYLIEPRTRCKRFVDAKNQRGCVAVRSER
jgi:hypothetical protein